MKILSLNVNGLRSAIKKGLLPWLVAQKAEVICLQEIKATEIQLPSDIDQLSPYHAFYFPAERKGYSGVAVYSLKKPDKVQYGLGWNPCDNEGRYLQLDFGHLSVASIYLPSGSAGEHRQKEKFIFMEKFVKDLERMAKEKRQYILCGDWNIARTNKDLKNWRSNQKNSGFLPEERAWLNDILSQGSWYDAFRELYPEKVQYSWWSQRGQAFAKDVGWRIDYQLISASLRQSLYSFEMLREPKFSDHAVLMGCYKEDELV